MRTLRSTAVKVTTAIATLPIDTRRRYATGMRIKLVGSALLTVLAISTAACEKRPSLFPNSDPALRKTSAEFASDALNRHPYEAEPRGETLVARAAVDYMLNTIQVVNLSQEEWTEIEIWVNQTYVVWVPKIEANGGIRTLNFEMFHDSQGRQMPTRSKEQSPFVKQVEAVRNGTIHAVPIRLAD